MKHANLVIKRLGFHTIFYLMYLICVMIISARFVQDASFKTVFVRCFIMSFENPLSVTAKKGKKQS